jgi:hypothetical protein
MRRDEKQIVMVALLTRSTSNDLVFISGFFRAQRGDGHCWCRVCTVVSYLVRTAVDSENIIISRIFVILASIECTILAIGLNKLLVAYWLSISCSTSVFT